MNNKTTLLLACVSFVLGFLIAAAIMANSNDSTKLSQDQARAFYYRGVYDECANVTIQDVGTGKVIDRPPERCAQVVWELKNNGFLERFYKTPIPTYIPPEQRK